MEKLRYMHCNPGRDGPLAEPEHWEWSSYRSYTFQEEGRVKISLWPKAVIKIRTVACPGGPSFAPFAKGGLCQIWPM